MSAKPTAIKRLETYLGQPVELHYTHTGYSEWWILSTTGIRMFRVGAWNDWQCISMASAPDLQIIDPSPHKLSPETDR